MMLGLGNEGVELQNPTPTNPVLELGKNCFSPSLISKTLDESYGPWGLAVCVPFWGIIALAIWSFLPSGGRR